MKNKINPWKHNITKAFFTEPLINKNNTFGTEWNNEIAPYYKKALKIKSEREMTLICNLLVENQIEKLILEAIPMYKSVFKGFSNYSSKLKFLKSMNLIPSQFIEMAEKLNQIRNEFAHQLDKVEFEDISHNLFEDLLRIHKKFSDSRMHEYNELLNRKSLYIDIWRLCISAMHDYRYSIKIYMIESRSEEFHRFMFSKYSV